LDYRLYLDKKEKNDYTGIEDTIYKKISESKLDWIPSSEADEEEKEPPAYAEKQTELLESLKTMMEDLTKKVEAIKIPQPETKAPDAPAPAPAA